MWRKAVFWGGVGVGGLHTDAHIAQLTLTLSVDSNHTPLLGQAYKGTNDLH